MKVLELKLEQIEVLDNSRERVDGVQELMASIKANGLLQPIGVWPKEDNPNQYTLVYGHRRFAAVKKLGWEKVDAIITPVDKESDYYIANLTENMHRKDVTVAEQARVIETLIHSHGLSPAEVAARLGYTPVSLQKIRMAIKNVPVEFRGRINNKPGNRLVGDGTIALSTALEINQLAKRQGLNQEATRKVFGAAEKGNINSKNVSKVTALLRSGHDINEAIELATDVDVIHLTIPIKAGTREKMKKTYGNSYKSQLIEKIYAIDTLGIERP